MKSFHIHEIHPLVFSDLYEKYDGFKQHSTTDVFCILSCMYDMKVSDDKKEHLPSELVHELKFMSERMDYYNDQEVKYELCSSYVTIQYDMMKYVKQWLQGCGNETEAILLIQEIKREKEWFTGDFIKCCLKLVNMAKELEDVCSLDFLEKIKEGSSKLLKFVCIILLYEFSFLKIGFESSRLKNGRHNKELLVLEGIL